VTYRAVVKYPVDAEPREKRRALIDGLGEIAAELVREHDATMEEIEDLLHEAECCARDEADAMAGWPQR
jgi:predicted transcriptional regulator